MWKVVDATGKQLAPLAPTVRDAEVAIETLLADGVGSYDPDEYCCVHGVPRATCDESHVALAIVEVES